VATVRSCLLTVKKVEISFTLIGIVYRSAAQGFINIKVSQTPKTRAGDPLNSSCPNCPFIFKQILSFFRGDFEEQNEVL
jgi:hypothetical protein